MTVNERTDQVKITKLSAYHAWLPYVGGQYKWGRGFVIENALTTVIAIETDAGLTGYGECCPIEGDYLAAYPEGIVPALKRLAPAIIGLDPREVHLIERAMDRVLIGHSYAKTPIDNACWDLLGKATEQPVYRLLGGKLTEGGPMYRVVPQKPVEEARREMEVHRQAGYRQFQIKAGADWRRDIEAIHAAAELLNPGERAFADANRGWTLYEAVQVVRATKGLDIMIEQPCFTYEECLQVRRHCEQPMKLDEVVTDLKMAQRIVQDQAAEVFCLKISNLGGLTKARRVRDFLCEQGYSVVSEDTWGSEITTAACAHFAASTPPELLYNTTDLSNYNTVSICKDKAITKNGKLYASEATGLGVEPDFSVLGKPVVVYQ